MLSHARFNAIHVAHCNTAPVLVLPKRVVCTSNTEGPTAVKQGILAQVGSLHALAIVSSTRLEVCLVVKA